MISFELLVAAKRVPFQLSLLPHTNVQKAKVSRPKGPKPKNPRIGISKI
jgi:hypothetical protein